MKKLRLISPCLWFDGQAEQAANFYVSVFENSRIAKVTRYTEAGHEVHHQPAGKVMTVEFELDGQPFLGLNGGPLFKFNEAVSFIVTCDTQEQIDYFWDKLSAGGDPKGQACGWLKDQFGVSWQIVPSMLGKLMSDPARAPRVMGALMKMKKLEIAELQRASDGTS